VERALASIAVSAGCYPKIQKLPQDACHSKMEFRLGEILADAVGIAATAVVEHLSGGVKPETNDRFCSVLVQLYEIWRASRFGSYNAESRRHEPYFENRYGTYNRLNFDEAVQLLGMDELTLRYVDVPEAVLHALLTFVLNRFEVGLDQIVALQERD
jgi:hypothetical protein